MNRIVKIAEINALKKSRNPIIVYSLTEESEAIANSCRDHGVNVVAFCDNEIRKSKSTLVVVGQMSSASGIVTLEDILEEILGEIKDEHDK